MESPGRWLASDKVGSYALQLLASGSGIIDTAGNALAANANHSWVMNTLSGTAANDQILLIKNGTVTEYRLAGAYQYTFDASALGQLFVDAKGGDDEIVLNMFGGAALPLSVTGGEGDDGISFVGTSGDDSVGAAADQITLAGGFGNHVVAIAGVENLQLAGGTGGSDSLAVTSGTFGVDASTPSGAPNVAVTVTGPSTVVEFATTQRLNSLTLSNGASAIALQAPTTRGSTIVVGGLHMSPDSRFDLFDNDLAIDYACATVLGSFDGSSYTGITGLIALGGGGVTGIISSTADGSQTLLGVAEAGDVLGISGSDTALWNGQTVDATTVLVKYTYAGDANLERRDRWRRLRGA